MTMAHTLPITVPICSTITIISVFIQLSSRSTSSTVPILFTCTTILTREDRSGYVVGATTGTVVPGDVLKTTWLSATTIHEFSVGMFVSTL